MSHLEGLLAAGSERLQQLEEAVASSKAQLQQAQEEVKQAQESAQQAQRELQQASQQVCFCRKRASLSLVVGLSEFCVPAKLSCYLPRLSNVMSCMSLSGSLV